MLRVTCDCCGKDVPHGDEHHIVKIEVFVVATPAGITEADLDEDHMEVVGQILRDMEESGQEATIEPRNQQFRYDLCSECRQRFARDPLGRETAPKFHFSKN